MILDSYSTRSSNVCNQLTKKEPSEEPTTTLLLKRSSPSPPSPPSSPPSLATALAAATFTTSVLNSPKSVDDTTATAVMMTDMDHQQQPQQPHHHHQQQSSRSPSPAASEDLDELETSSEKSSTDIDAGSGSRTAAAAVDCKSPKSKVTADAEMSSPLTGKASGGETKEAEAACGPQISQLVDNMQRLESTINSLRESTATQISQLEEMLTTKNRIIADLEDKLDQQRDYEEIKRELTFVRTELSHLGPTLAEAAAVAAASAAAGAAPDPKALESFLLEKSKLALQEKISEGDAAAAAAAAAAAQQMMASAAGRAGGHPFFNPFSLPQLQGLGNVESFGTLLGEEIATTYAKAIAKRDPSFLAMAAAAAANQNSNSGSNGKLHSSNNSNNLPDSLSPSQISNGDEAAEELKSVGSLSASTTPTSAMMTLCSDGGPGGLDGSSAAVQLQLGQSPLHSAVSAAAAADLGLSLGSRSYSPSTTSIANSTASGGGSIPQSTSASYDRLQQQLRCNVEKYMNETLNTLQISRCVRELLSMHNIGQRLFAKYVLGLSQGTVSELLSKPKPWDKLTEKGRDSYRKMHAWATDERCINLLKSLVPRKGKDNSFKQEDPVAEERIAAILSEAQRSMKGGGRQDFFSSPVFLNGGADHHHHHHHSHQQHQQQAHLQQQQQQQHLHHHQLSNSLKMERDSLKNNNSSVASDNLSDNGSDREEKVADLLGGDRKSPANALNATALATINNFYRNLDSAQNNSFGESANRSSRQSNSKSSNLSSKQQQQQQQQQEQQSAEEELLQSPDIMRLYQDQLAKLIGQHIEEGFRNSANQNNNYEDVRNAVNFYNHELARSMNPFAAAQQAANPELFARLFSAGLLNGTGYLGGLGPLGLETLQQQQQSGGSQLEGLGSNSSSSNSGSRQKGGTSHPQLESPQPREHHHHHHHHGHNHRDHLSSSGNSSVQQQMDSRSKLDSMLSALKVEHPSSPSHNGSLNGGVGGSVLSNGSDLNGGGSGNAEDLAASPLQRMQSITNSLLSQSALPSLPTTSSRPAKAVLPPITQQQFDQYNNLNTEDIVKRVKEQLSQYSISQRLFGESVLGLSQGSVSDLLARPKPWHMLTQKGREPFIRMKMFLEDDNAIHKLVASQYKIAPEKLMRTGSFVAGTAGVSGLPTLPMTPSGVLAALPSSSTPPAAASSSLPLSATPPNSKLGGGGSSHSHHSHAHHYKGASLATEPIISIKYEHSLSPSSLADSGARSNSSTPDPGLPTMPSSASSPLGSARGQRGGSSGGVGGMGAAVQVAPQYAAALTSTLLRQQQQQQTVLTPTSVAAASAGGVGGGYIQPSVYELAALTSDLDTQIITTRIKETLMAHNIGQKIFGEVVLGLSQGSVSELLSKPKPWHMLSIKGREPFIRMQLWLNDPNNIEKLQTLKNERREANKRRRTHMDDDRAMVAAYGKSLDSQLFSFSNTFGGLAGAGAAGGSLGGKGGGMGAAGLLGSGGLTSGLGPFSLSSPVGPQQPTVKKARILFTEEQKEALRIAFSMDPYPSSTTAEFLAKELNLSIRTITNWFHNHRMRLKQINTSANNGGGGGNGDEGSNQTSTTATTTTTLPYSIGRDGVSFDQSHFRNLLAQRLSELKLRAAAGGGSGGNGGNGSNTGGGGNISSNHSSNGSTNSSQSNSNHFGSVFGSGAGSPQPHHRFKYSSLHGGGGGGGGLVNSFQSQSVYSNNTNSCSSPGSTSPFQEEEDDDDEEEEEDMGTLDLSMTSQQQQQQQQLQLQLQRGQQLVAELDKLDSTGRSSVQDDSDDGEGANEADSDEEQRKAAAARQLELAAKQLFGSSRRKPQLVVSSSSRRKAAQPQQWVAPVVEEPTPPPQQRAQFDDDYAEDSYEDDRDDLLSEEDEPKEAATAQDASKVASALINGNNSRKAETASVLEALSKRLVAGPNDVDDQKTDEEEDGEMEEDSVRRGGDNGNGNGEDGAVDSDTDQEISENISTATSSVMPPYKKLKTSSSSTSVMSKLAISDDSSNNILQQECVQ